jgi:hypothetical protein
METLINLVYVSRAADSFRSREQRHSLKQRAVDYNTRHSITGVLVYSQGVFLQLLEGPESAVNALFGDICVDERHAAIKVLTRSHISVRRYADWSMGVIDTDDTSNALVTAEARLLAVKELQARSKREPVTAVRYVEVFLDPALLSA